MKYEPPHDKTNKMTVRPAKTQISLGIRPIWSESSLCAQWLLRTQAFFMRSAKTLIRSESSLGVHAILLVLSRCGSNIKFYTRCNQMGSNFISLFILKLKEENSSGKTAQCNLYPRIPISSIAKHTKNAVCVKLEEHVHILRYCFQVNVETSFLTDCATLLNNA